MKQYVYRQNSYIVLVLLIFYTVSMPMWAIAHGWKAPSEAAQQINPLPMNAASIEEGRKAYSYACASCHGKNTRGDGPIAKDLDTKPADLIKRIENHSEGDFYWKISTGRGNMPGFEGELTKRQIWSIINYIKSLKTLSQ